MSLKESLIECRASQEYKDWKAQVRKETKAKTSKAGPKAKKEKWKPRSQHKHKPQKGCLSSFSGLIVVAPANKSVSD